MPRGTTVLMPGDHVFVAMRMNLEPLIDRLFDPDPEPAAIPPGLRLSFHSATSVEQLHRFLGLPVPQGISPERAAQGLGFLLAQAAPQRQLAIGAACLHPGLDPDHVAVTLRSEQV